MTKDFTQLVINLDLRIMAHITNIMEANIQKRREIQTRRERQTGDIHNIIFLQIGKYNTII